MSIQAARAVVMFGSVILGATVTRDLFKKFMDYVKTEKGRNELKEKFGVEVLQYAQLQDGLQQKDNVVGKGAFGTVFRIVIPQLHPTQEYAAKQLDQEGASK